MATPRTRTRTAAPAKPVAAPTRRQKTGTKATPATDDNSRRKFQWEYVDINDVVPYDYNPRDNEKAIPAVAESIRNFGFIIPIVLDSNNILVAGHTRVEGAKLLGMTEVPAVRADHLTPEQVNAFRLIDNKVSELAMWDFDMLAGEINKLADTGINWTDFGWRQEEIDCLSEVVQEECLTGSESAAVAAESASSVQSRRAPVTARFVLGELVFFAPSNQYRTWIDGLRQLHDFNETAMVEDVKRRLGMLE